MTDKPLTIQYKDKCIRVDYVRTGKNNMKDLLDRINIDDYIIIKATQKFRIVEKEEFLNMVNTKYLLYHKELYNLDYIKELFQLINPLIKFLGKSLPPRYVLELVKKNKQI